jgi:lactosylceramide 4-alpha-galactosyltransferase
MTRQQCLGFTVLPQPVFYAIPYTAWRLLFNPRQSSEAMRKVEASYGVHVWNKMSSQENVTVGSEQAYGLLAAAHCPRVYSSCGAVF